MRGRVVVDVIVRINGADTPMWRVRLLGFAAWLLGISLNAERVG